MQNRLERFCLLASFALPLAAYFFTAAPGPFWEDSATFSMAAATLSIPHSPGFPLWVLTGKLFTWLIPQNPARATNLMCGLFGAGAVTLFYLCAKRILLSLAERVDPSVYPYTDAGDGGGTARRAPTVALTALGAALIFAFSQTVWLQAVRAEVYSLQLLLTLSIVWIALSLPDSEKPTRLFLLAVLLWGLSAAVHPLLSVSVLPGLLIMGCFKSATWKKEISKWSWAFGFIMLAASVYLFLPIRSAQDPYLNWNQPDNWERFWAAVSRSGDWQASLASSSTNVSYPNAMRLAVFMMSEYSAVFWLFAAAGIVRTAHYLPKAGAGIFILLLSNFLATLWAAEFNAWNMDLLGYLSFGTGMAVLCAVAGVFELAYRACRNFGRLSPVARGAVPLTVGVFAFFLAEGNWARADLHKSFWPDRIARDTFRSLPPNAVVFYSSDRFLTAALYRQGALGQRRDVAILLTNVFVFPPLLDQTRRRHPDLVLEPAPTEGSAEKRMQEGFKTFCRKNNRPIFTQLGYHIEDTRSFWPAGYLLEYRRETVGPEVPKQVVEFAEKTFKGKMDFLSRESLGMEIHNWGAYLSKIGAPENELLFKKAAEFDGENPRTWSSLGKTYLFKRRFALAESCFKLALSLDRYNGKDCFYLAYALEQQGKTEEAKFYLAEGDFLVPDKLKRGK